MNFVDRILIKDYDEKTLNSFWGMNMILTCVLFLFAFMSFMFLWVSYDEIPPLRLEQMTRLDGSISKIYKNRSKEDGGYNKLDFFDKNRNSHILHFRTTQNYPLESYENLIGKNIRLWIQKTKYGLNNIEQIQYLDNGKYFKEYDYLKEKQNYEYYISDFYRSTYLQWGGGALALWILKFILITLIKRRYYELHRLHK